MVFIRIALPFYHNEFVIQQEQNSVIWEYGYLGRLQIGKNIRVGQGVMKSLCD